MPGAMATHYETVATIRSSELDGRSPSERSAK
jgi:hypothetical protein